MPRPLRRCWKYVPVRCELADIKKGDVYQLEPFDETDTECPMYLLIAEDDAVPKPDGEPGSVVTASDLILKPGVPQCLS